MAAEIDRPDLITDGALRVPYDMAEGFNVAEKELDDLIKMIQRHELAAQEQADTVNKLMRRIDVLEKEQKKLVDTNKKLTEEVKKNKKALKEQGDAMEALDNRVGGTINRFRTLGKELLAIAKSPVVLTLGIIIGLLAALGSSVKTFFAATGEGEDMLERQSAIWGQFFSSVKKGWSDLGKSITDFFGEAFSRKAVNGLITAAQAMMPFFGKFFESVRANFNKTFEDADKLAVKMDNLADKMIANIVRQSETNKKSNELVLKSQDDINFSDQQRLGFLEEAVRLQEEQMRINTQLAKEQSKNLLTEIGLRHALTAAEAKALTEQQRAAIFTEEENKQLAESVAKVIDLEGNYYQEVKRNVGKIVNLKQLIYKKDLEAAEQAARDRVQSLKVMMDEEIDQVESSVRRREITERQGESRILKIRKDYSDLFAQQQIDSINKILDSMQLLPEDRARLEQQLFKLGEDLRASFFEGFKETNSDIEETLQGIKKQFDAFAGSVVSIFESITERRIQELDKQEAASEAAMERELKAAGDNEQAKEKIEDKFNKKKEQIERQKVALLRRAAIFEKAIAAAQATINTAVAVTALLETPPLAIAAGIAGALQVAAILAEPLPAYAEGGVTKTPYVLAGEQGTEAYVTPGGKLGFTPDEATKMKLPIGTEIFSHGDTMGALALSAMNAQNTVGDKRDVDNVSAEVRKLAKIVKNKKELNIHFSSRGAEASLRNADNWIKLLNEYYG